MITKALIRKFQDIVGKKSVDATREGRISHAYDATRIKHQPELVVYPGNGEDVSKILMLCNQEKIPVYPRGAGSGFAGGSVPAKGGIVLVMTRMNRILGIYPEDLYAVVEPGVVNGVFQKTVEKMGLFYPPDPGSMAFSTLGGNVATGAGGLRSLKYGVTRDYVLRLVAVLASGEFIETGVKTLKGVVGYDLTRLIVGSEGTLAVVTEITLKLIPKPETTRTAFAAFRDHGAAGTTVADIIASRILPSTLEFMDGNCLRAVEAVLDFPLPAKGDAYLLIEVDGGPSEVERDIGRIKDICQNHGAATVMMAQSPEEREDLWKARRSISQAINRMGMTKINEDVAVPRSKIPAILDFLQQLADRQNLQILTFGHAGDGNLHVNILADAQDLARARECVTELFEEVLRLEGTISAEHGVGLAKAPYMGMEISPTTLATMRAIKQTLDPKGILNPGKLFHD
ncbi:MAG: FAD-linked oxidase C-terminal domain-containing protein [bacterium]|nr:FAD-linked oxidase C-terminal domain-containing protein [bacterium]